MRVVRADPLAEMLLGRMLAGELRLERAHEHIVHERALAAARHSRHGRHRIQRQAQVHALEVVLPRAGEHEPLWADAAARLGNRDLARTGDVFAGEWTLRHARHRPGEHQLAALLAAVRAELHHVVRRLDGVEVVLDDEHRVAAVAQAQEQLEEPVHVARVQPDGRLVQHVERVHEPRAERVGEADALRLAARERARGAVEREVVETDVAEEAHAILRLLQDVCGDLLLEWRELERVQPCRELSDWQIAHLGDVATGHLHLERFRLKLGAAAVGALLRGLILPEEDADVLLVALLLEVAQEGKDSLVAARAGVQQLVPLRHAELLEGTVHRDPFLLRELRELAAHVVVARLGPRIDRAVAQGALRIGHDQRLVVLEHRAEPVAPGAGASRRVEGEELGRGRRRGGAVVRALEPLGEAKARDGISVERRDDLLREEDDRVAIALAKRRAQRVGETAARLLSNDEPVDDDEQLLREGHVDVGDEQLVEMAHVAVEAHAHEALRAKVLDHDLVSDLGGELERRGDVEAGARGKREHRVGDRLDGVGLELAAAFGAERMADASPEEPQVVVDLGRGPNRGPRRLGGILLLDRHGGREAVDVIDGGLLHALEELARVRRQRLDVAALSFGVDRVEGERGLARAGGSRDDREGASRDLEVEAFEVVLPRAADDDLVLHAVGESKRGGTE